MNELKFFIGSLENCETPVSWYQKEINGNQNIVVNSPLGDDCLIFIFNTETGKLVAIA